METVQHSDHETAELLLILERRGVDEGARAEIVSCRTADEIRDWVAAVPFQIAAKGGKLIKSEAAILFWALRRDVGPKPRALPAAFVRRRQIELAAAAADELRRAEAAAAAAPAIDDEAAAEKARAAIEAARANLPARFRRNSAGGAP